jgi:hypothetical protein
MKRVILAGLLGGVILFVWGAVAHEALPLGEAGVRALDNEQVQTALKGNVKESGFYIFPMPDMAAMSKEQQQKAMEQAEQKMRAGPTGIMVVYPQGREFLMPQHLATQAVTDLLTGLLAATLLYWAASLKSYSSRVLFIVLLGLFPTLTVELPQWNWYGFPTVYMLAQLAMHLIGFLLAGLLLARMVRPKFAQG